MIKQDVLYITGPTTTGKTALSVKLSEELPDLVFINADKMQLYTGLEPLVMHPTPEEFSKIEHRMFSILNLGENFDRNDWIKQAKQEIKETLDNGKTPVLIGGTESFVSALARKSFGLNYDKDIENVTPSRDLKDSDTDFSFNLRIVSLSRGNMDFRGKIKRVIDKITDASIKAIQEAISDGATLSTKGFMVMGTKEFINYLDGEIDLDTAKLKLLDRACAFSDKQANFFNKLNRGIANRHPHNLLVLDADKAMEEKVSSVVSFINSKEQGFQRNIGSSTPNKPSSGNWSDRIE